MLLKEQPERSEHDNKGKLPDGSSESDIANEGDKGESDEKRQRFQE